MNSGIWKWTFMVFSATWCLSVVSFADDEKKKDEPAPEQKAEERPSLNSVEAKSQAPGDPAVAQERDRDVPDVQRLQEIRRKIAALREEGKQEEAAELQRQAESLMRRVQGEQGRERMDAMRRQIEELRESGRLDQATELERHLQEMMRRQREVQGREGAEPGRDGGRPELSPPNREEMERRLGHLREAAANLEAAGLHDLANQLRRQAEEIVARNGRPDGRGPDLRRPGADGRGPGPDGRRPGPDGREPRPEGRDSRPDGGPGLEGREVQELRANIQELNERFSRLEQLVRKLAEQSNRGEEKRDRD